MRASLGAAPEHNARQVQRDVSDSFLFLSDWNLTFFSVRQRVNVFFFPVNVFFSGDVEHMKQPRRTRRQIECKDRLIGEKKISPGDSSGFRQEKNGSI